MDESRPLNPHYTISRYPNAANGVPSEVYTREVAEWRLLAAARVLEWVMRSGGLS